MIGSTWNVVFVAIAMGAGMFAQQAAHKVSAASEDKQVSSLVGLELFCSAEGYYLAGRFNNSAPATESSSASPALPPENEQPLVAANETPPNEVLPPTEPAVATAPPVLEPPATELVAAAETSAMRAPEPLAEVSVAADVGPEPAAPEPPMPAGLASGEPKEPAAEMPAADVPVSAGEALSADTAAEVLPPPAPDAESRVGGDNFGKFADDRARVDPPRSSVRPPLPTGMLPPAGQTYLDATAGQGSRYITPSDLVRDRAMARGEQRRQRIETRKWLGISPLRPTVDTTPFTMVEQPAQLLLVVPDATSTFTR